MEPITLYQNERIPLHCLTEITKTCKNLYEFHEHPNISGAHLTHISVRNSIDVNHKFLYDLVYCGPSPGDITKLCYTQDDATKYIAEKNKQKKNKN